MTVPRFFFLRWMATFLGFPAGGLLVMLTVGSVTGPLSAVIGGALCGAVIGAAQWLALRSAGIGPSWVAHTAVAMSAASALMAGLTGGSTQVGSLVVTGLVVGAAVGAVQGVVLRRGVTAIVVWTVVVAAAWAVGWLVTTRAGVDVERGYIIFGSSGAVVASLVTGAVMRRLLRVRPVVARPSVPATGAVGGPA